MRLRSCPLSRCLCDASCIRDSTEDRIAATTDITSAGSTTTTIPKYSGRDSIPTRQTRSSPAVHCN